MPLRVSPKQWLAFSTKGVMSQTNVLALDDIELYEGPCLTNATLPDFTCKLGNTIPFEQVLILLTFGIYFFLQVIYFYS